MATAVGPATVLLADGSDPVAVSLGPIAYRQGWPVLYWSSRGLSPDSLELLARGDVQVVLLAGGQHVQAVRAQLRELDVEPDVVGEG